MQFCTLLEVVKSIVVINSAQKIFHGLSSVHKSVGLKSSIIIFTHFHAVDLDQK